MKEDIVKSFNKIALLDDKWDHNQNYEKLLLSEVDSGLKNALDIGCGTGEFTQKLSKRVDSVLGIDISPIMVEEAKKRHTSNNIQYIVKDFDELNENTKYDCIVSVATFHHLDIETALPKINRILNKNGILIVLDLYDRKGLIDFVLDLVAVPANLILEKLKNGKTKEHVEEIQVWKEHSNLDNYMTYKDLKKIYNNHFGNSIKFKRLLFWRYIMIYRK
ncbi:ubiquinone/menaquinone biosynthesis C-methylase UbiE [Clostridium tetanomorphum]|uniref:Class I SAM-dependent methyltransferase n=1 Tax=Clostridium tetanomorphum TaxID=1553 RepID=A0A923EBH9_CLOTT|nr:class I SAM-dependent methyltransferase [Clostridium tetanomorphum]KAJ51917.1 type 11 methyltransferase [Clostridium tetanomorphum DSM 665]MBC2398646.1 class I SAM-dependent methyltransferase [Clostridium tetanomorphum]MBP1864075.1 ubiquinone/menaquinone biosynthesis C-methylase UbiE [Clostridium tetanomorphum]NRS84488.1 ubiquinone/menaquinone biosynthesis C-methylase UbiE [Clostridium tetanomorphum]NRZ97702.1 ubiquinone/menaquinone biosynthesis C-methylase UbiE [Clostridium tetanomorphum]